MKLTLGEAKAIAMALPKVMEERLPVKTAYWFARTLRELSGHVTDFEQARMKLLDKYVKKDKKGKWIEKGDQYDLRDTEAFNKEFVELSSQEISITFDGVTLDQLGVDRSCPHCGKEIKGGADIRGTDLFNLGRLIKDETEQTDKKQKQEIEKGDHHGA